MNVVNLTTTLIDIESITGNEGPIGNFLADYLTQLGWHIELQPVSLKRSNLIATLNATPQLFFSTHLDTVPPFIKASEDDKYIYGRGACDAKGIIAAQIVAAENLRKNGFTNLGLLYTVDEEASSAGAKIANNHRLASQCRYLINGEPTDNRLAVFSKGSLRVSLRAKGQAAHSAYPEQGVSAIDTLLDALAKVRAYSWPVDEINGATTCNIGIIAGGSATNVIAETARADLHFRIITSAFEVIDTCKNLLNEKVHLEVISQTEPVKLFSIHDFTQCTVRFTTDIPHLTNWGVPLLIGPGSIFAAHTINERILKSELLEAVHLYEQIARQLFEIEAKLTSHNSFTP